MRTILLLFLCCCCCVAVSSAQPKQITLTGIIAMTTGEVFPYKLVLSESEGRVNGYSVTYSEPNETKTTIKGLLDRHSHSLSFRETEIISSHGFRTRAYMCLVDAGLQYVAGGKGNVLTGQINTTETDKTSCTGGNIIFNNDDEIQNLFGYHDKFDTVISMGKKHKDAYASPPARVIAPDAPLVTDKVTAGIEKSYDWHSDTVVLEVWDGGNIDGDRISVSFNGKPYLTNYFLVKEKRQIRIPITGPGVNTLTIFADNEGSDPPNTASLMLTDGAKQYSVLAYNPKGQQAIIKIKKVR